MCRVYEVGRMRGTDDEDEQVIQVSGQPRTQGLLCFQDGGAGEEAAGQGCQNTPRIEDLCHVIQNKMSSFRYPNILKSVKKLGYASLFQPTSRFLEILIKLSSSSLIISKVWTISPYVACNQV